MSKSRRLLRMGWILVAVLLCLALVVLPACTTPPAEQQEEEEEEEEPEEQTLKIGCLLNFEFPLAIDCLNELDALVPVFNDRDGLVIDGVKYNVELIIEDSKFDPAVATAAVEKLIYQDEVDFILGDETTDAWVSIAEENDVLVVATSPSPVLMDPQYERVFQASDDLKGHAEAGMLEYLCDVFDRELLDILYYPATPDFVEFASYAEALVAQNPDVYCTCAGGPVQDALSIQAMSDAGFEGQVFLYVALSVDQMEAVLGDLSAIEGMIAVAVATELDTPSAVAQELIDAYTAAQGGFFPPPVILHVNNFYCLMEALNEAQSLDVDDVAAVIGDGLEFDSPQAPAVMISRPDFGNDRTVDALFEAYMIQVVGGEPELIHTISLAEALEKVQMTFP